MKFELSGIFNFWLWGFLCVLSGEIHVKSLLSFPCNKISKTSPQIVWLRFFY